MFFRPSSEIHHISSLKAQAPKQSPRLSPPWASQDRSERAEGSGTLPSLILWRIHILARAGAGNQDPIASFCFPFVDLSALLRPGQLCFLLHAGADHPTKGKSKRGLPKLAPPGTQEDQVDRPGWEDPIQVHSRLVINTLFSASQPSKHPKQ